MSKTIFRILPLLALMSVSGAVFAQMSGSAPAQDAATKKDEAVTLRRAFTAGEKTTYVVNSVMDGKLDLSQFGQGMTDMTMKSSMNLQVIIDSFDKDKKSAKFTGKATENTLEMEPAPPGMTAPKEFTVKGEVNERNEVTDPKIEGIDGMSKMMVMGTVQTIFRSLVFPEGPVKVGDTWAQPKSVKFEGGTTDSDLKATFNGIDKLNDKSVYKITIKGTTKSVGEAKGEEGGMGNIKSTTESTVDSVVLLDIETGKILQVTTSGDVNVATEIVDMGVTVPVKGHYTSKIVLKA
jgi:hypothetical protein